MASRRPHSRVTSQHFELERCHPDLAVVEGTEFAVAETLEVDARVGALASEQLHPKHAEHEEGERKRFELNVSMVKARSDGGVKAVRSDSTPPVLRGSTVQLFYYPTGFLTDLNTKKSMIVSSTTLTIGSIATIIVPMIFFMPGTYGSERKGI